MRWPFLKLFTVSIIVLIWGCKNFINNSLFTKLSENSTGIDFQNTLFEDGPLNVANYIYFYNGGGVSIGDINNDGLQDILFTGNMVKNRLYLNKGNFEFEDITQKSGIADKQGWCTGANMEDFNNDGKLDIYICRSADINPEMRKNLLFINNGNLTFTDKAEEYGLADNGYSTQASFLDYDKDGDLDCFIINHSVQKYTAGVQDNIELRNEKNPDYASKLYRNDNQHYTEVSEASGITSNVLSFGLGVAISDFNNDGWPDISVSNDFNEPDYLFMNNGNGSFTEKLAQSMDNISLYSMGSDAADYNNDGLIDLITLDMMPEDNKTIKMHSGAENFDKFQSLFKKGFYYQYSRNMLQQNNGDGTFSEVGQLAGVSNTDWSWAALFGDYDNDGNKDLFITNGYVKDYTEMDFLKYSVDRVLKTMAKEEVDPIPEYIRKMPKNEIPNYIFQNKGDGTFEKKTKDWGFDSKGVSAGAAYADLDNDGDLDLVVNNSNDFAGIYRNNNETINKTNYLKIKLEGNMNNQRGVGAKIQVYCNGELFYQEQSPVRGFQSSQDPILNFGIGKNKKVDSILVIWPNDKYQKFTNLNVNQTLNIKQKEANDTWIYGIKNKKSKTIFQHEDLKDIVHKENDFNDFAIQSLLPNFLSRQGPCLATSDINGDGLDDFLIGGARGQEASLYVQNPNGSFNKKTCIDFAKDTDSEDVACSFFDADGDGDQDLYIASGGYEFEENDKLLQDRIYINDGSGNFTKKVNALPKFYTSSGCIKAADIDGDGDLDLFVGGRLVPKKYPQTPESYILINNGKAEFKFADPSNYSDLNQIGMVTDATWLDLNKDKQPDLIVVGEWMPIKVYINSKGKLVDETEKYIHFSSNGWWNKIEANDLDSDGDLDLLIGNTGLNTQFKVSEREPFTVHFKDFSGGGNILPILSYFIGGTSYPAASKDDITDPLPHLKKNFLAYKDYANATINDLFTKEELKDAKILKAETMETIILENKGKEGFVKLSLPIQAQIAPVNAFLVDDFNKDGKKDILLGGNNSWTRIKYGRYSANHGVLLVGQGNFKYKYVPQHESGLKLLGNLKSIKALKSKNNKIIIAGFNDKAIAKITF